ncbi:MAG: lasso peptide biosynthesis B2 protein [Planctomycetales bacterium]
MQRLRRFFLTSWPDRWLLVEAVWLTAWARLAVLILPWRWVSPFFGDHMQSTTLQQDADNDLLLRRVSWAVQAADRHVPWKAKCLIQALAARSMLSRRGVEGTIYLGMCKTAENEFKAHAWTRCGQRLVSGATGHEAFTVVSTFAFGPCQQGRLRTTYDTKEGEPKLYLRRRLRHQIRHSRAA